MRIPPSQASFRPQDSTTSVLIVADVRLYREGLATKLSNTPGLAVVGTASTREEARERPARLART